MKQKIPLEILKKQGLVLPQEIEGVKTFYQEIKAKEVVEVSLAQDTANIYIVLSGNGRISAGDKDTEINGMAIYIPKKADKISISAASDLEVLQIVWQLTKEESASINQESFPYYLRYNDAKTYKEAIKSPKTINRTLVHEDLIPRFCMGSVETEGPDAVGAHSHPMLEQHFFGLNNNYCYVKADEAEILFPERALLHIPLGSEHSVRVEDGKKLHYIWIDYFRDAAGVEWIKKMHKSDE
ncbi:MAG: hypothetical protein JNL74_15355 [Fibrobacteres bacterium]|nr:hypothetical protein [Fibrobacterota bacterium]